MCLLFLSAADESLELLAPGLKASGLCPLANSNPQAVIDAIAQGSNAAYNKGQNAQVEYAKAMGAAVGAAQANGCIDTVFELVNQAIIKGGYPTEVVVGRALALGTAKGVDSETGEVLAQATAVVICRGGESASACARAWSQAIKMDKNGCLVLVKAYAHAKAKCGPGYATNQVSATVFKEPLGVCKAPEFTSAPPPAPAPTTSQAPPTYTPSQTNGGGWKPHNFGGGMTVSQGWGGQTFSGGGMSVSQGSGFPSWMTGRKMLSVSVSGTVVAGQGNLKLFGISRALKNVQQGWSGWPFGGTDSGVTKTAANANSFAGNSGNANGGVDSMANAMANNPNGGWGGPSLTKATANSASVNTGNANGPVRSVSNAFANGR